MSAGTAFETARAEGRAALVGYLPAGFPDVPGAIEALHTMVDAGVDVLEIGLPYSDPVMDGPTIQAAAQQALDGGVRTADVLRTVEAVATTGVPTLVMTYWKDFSMTPLDTVLAYYKAWTSHDFDLAMTYVSDDIVCHAPAGQLTGAEAFRAFMEPF